MRVADDLHALRRIMPLAAREVRFSRVSDWTIMKEETVLSYLVREEVERTMIEIQRDRIVKVTVIIKDKEIMKSCVLVNTRLGDYKCWAKGKEDKSPWRGDKPEVSLTFDIKSGERERGTCTSRVAWPRRRDCCLAGELPLTTPDVTHMDYDFCHYSDNNIEVPRDSGPNADISALDTTAFFEPVELNGSGTHVLKTLTGDTVRINPSEEIDVNAFTDNTVETPRGFGAHPTSANYGPTADVCESCDEQQSKKDGYDCKKLEEFISNIRKDPKWARSLPYVKLNASISKGLSACKGLPDDFRYPLFASWNNIPFQACRIVVNLIFASASNQAIATCWLGNLDINVLSSS
ncbi:hypothetical protein RB195_022461 [Necator americanus]|uniref:Uncharacterized protein n=1 Tax=Necator americanus TaxID=51031 RepID=A0ABR1EFC8_NECAM